MAPKLALRGRGARAPGRFAPGGAGRKQSPRNYHSSDFSAPARLSPFGQVPARLCPAAKGRREPFRAPPEVPTLQRGSAPRGRKTARKVPGTLTARTHRLRLGSHHLGTPTSACPTGLQAQPRALGPPRRSATSRVRSINSANYLNPRIARKVCKWVSSVPVGKSSPSRERRTTIGVALEP